MFFKIPWALRAILYNLFFKRIGFFSYMGPPIFLKGTRNICIGNRVRIFPHYRMETYNQGSITIEDNCSIGQRFHVTAANRLRIGKNSTISFDVMVTDIDHNYENLGVAIHSQGFKISSTQIGENCFIGSGAKIQAGTILGNHCVVGANSVVRGSFPDYTVIAGVPARIVKQYCFTTNEWIKYGTKTN